MTSTRCFITDAGPPSHPLAGQDQSRSAGPRTSARTAFTSSVPSFKPSRWPIRWKWNSSRGGPESNLKSNLNISDNIVVKAADRVMKATRSTGRLVPLADKRIPWAAGWAGDRATLPRSCWRFRFCWRTASARKTDGIGGGSGKRCPVFPDRWNGGGHRTGRRSLSAARLDATPGLLIAPGIHSSTAAAYAALERKDFWTRFHRLSSTSFQSLVSGLPGQPPAPIPRRLMILKRLCFGNILN